jgi:hypothetical protein
VLDEITSVDLVLIGGDTVWGPMPRETMDLLFGFDIPTTWIMGNADRDVFDRVEGPWEESNDRCADRLTGTSSTICVSNPRPHPSTASCTATGHRGTTPIRSRSDRP